SSDQITHKFRKPIIAPFRPPIFDHHILAFDVPRLIQATPKGDYPRSWFGFRRSSVKQSNHRHRRLLRARHDRPPRRAAEQRNEVAPPDHSITSSAMASSVDGTVRPRMRAVSTLMTSSNLVACTTGKSEGFSPLRMRPA